MSVSTDTHQEARHLLWEIYQDIGRTNACKEMNDATKVEFIATLKEVTKLLEDQLTIYN